MASAGGVNVMTGSDVNNPAAAPSPATTGRQVSSRRRRRLEPPRVATTGGERRVRRRRGAAGAGASSSSSSLPQLVAAAAPAWPVAFGALSLAGWMFPKMEDTVSLRPGFHTWVDGSPMHFLGIFDGHGGFHVSVLCRDRMHEFLAEELQKEGASFLVRREQAMAPPPAGTTSKSIWMEQAEEELAWRAALARAFLRVDAVAAMACACGRVARPRCRCPLAAASEGLVGSTAVAALLVRGHIVVANCGDSRAVLCRGPDGAPPIPLSDDHKPNRPDELARIEALGGRVVCNDDVPRVRGILAMSRALGDSALKPEVISEPEITITERTADDQFMILASDGVWDVMSNKTACDVARQCLEERNPPPPIHPAVADVVVAAAVGHEAELRCSNAAVVLARFAFARDTRDNISVVVVDLKQRD